MFVMIIAKKFHMFKSLQNELKQAIREWDEV